MSTKTKHLLCISSIFLSSLLLLHATMLLASSEGEETENERDFAYIKGTGKGPDAWGKIHPEWKVCDIGNMQSPIDLLSSRVEIMPKLGDLKRHYKRSPASVKNRGHDIVVKWHGHAGGITINGTKYSLKQCHWHSPAEHTFNGTRNQLELHMVHESQYGRIAVVGMTYRYGKRNHFLEKIIPHIAKVGAEEKTIGIINPGKIKLDNKHYYRYVGSLTVPPCTEGVIWTIVKKVSTVSREQVMALREAVHDECEVNARPLQQSKGRKVALHDPKTP